jgi:hypothetical protein
MRLNNQIGMVPWEPAFKVNLAIDIGVRDSTTIIWWQNIGATVRIIDCYENSKEGLEFYAKIIQSKPYQMGRYIAPHDIAVKEWGSGMTRIEKAKQLGIPFTVAGNYSIEDGIEAVRSTLPKCWIDEVKCKPLIKALENYRQEWDDKRKVYKTTPLHDQWSHFCFVGDTCIATNRGDVAIKDIRTGDQVLTPLGYRKVLGTHRRLVAETHRIQTRSGGFETTAEHKIFAKHGLVSCDTLRYNDIVEHNSLLSRYLWKKLYSLCTEESDIKGFRNFFLLLKTTPKSCLMGIFLPGKETIIEQARIARERVILPFSVMFGHTTVARYLKGMLSTIRTVIQKTMIFPTLNVFRRNPILVGMPICQDLGSTPKPVRTDCALLMPKPKNGTEAKREESGTEITPRIVCQQLGGLNTQRFVESATLSMQPSKRGNSTVQTSAKLKRVSLRGWILLNALAICARLHSFVINTLLRKHVVSSVQINLHQQPKEVYDLTIETDNCYYANGYLVSNCDGMRYLCTSLAKTRDGRSSEDIDRAYAEAMHGGRQQFPGIFNDDLPTY